MQQLKDRISLFNPLGIIRIAYRLIRFNTKSLLLFTILYKLFTILILMPLLSFGSNIALKRSGYSYITTENMLSVIKNPTTIAVVILLLLLLAAFSIVEAGAYIAYFQYCRNNNMILARQMLLAGLAHLIRVLHPRKAAMFSYILIMLPITNIVLILITFGSASIPSYIIATLYNIKIVRYAFIVLTLLLILFTVYFLFTIHYCIGERKSFRAAIRNSIILMRKRKLRSFLYLLIWNVLLATITILLYLLVTLAAAASVVIWAKDSSALPLFLSILGKINTIMTAFLAVMCPIANFALVSAMYYRYKKETGEDVRVEVPPITDSEKIKKRMKKVFTLSVAVVISVNAYYFYSIVYNGLFGIEDALSPVKITSHRGNSVDAPENTLVALESAVDNLADYAEIDVQETKDGQIILLHDPNLKRTTGINKFIWELNYEEVAQLDAGSWFSDEYVGVKIPTFAEVLDYCKGKINLNVEIKNNGHSKDLEEKVVEIIKEYGFERQCVITSMNYESLVIVKKLNPDLKTGLIMPVVYGNFYDKQYSDFFSMKSNFITQRAISEAHSRGKEIHAWTVNTKNEMERLKNLGVDNIITDRPVAAREILYRSVANQTILGLLKSVLNQY